MDRVDSAAKTRSKRLYIDVLATSIRMDKDCYFIARPESSIAHSRAISACSASRLPCTGLASRYSRRFASGQVSSSLASACSLNSGV